MLRCVNDRYDADGSIPYLNLDDFLTMCLECFGDEPELREEADGSYTDEHGDLTLVPLEGEA